MCAFGWMDRLRPEEICLAWRQRKAWRSAGSWLIVTPESLASDWAEHEHDRARSLAKQGVPLVIPLLFGSAGPPTPWPT